jgi:hypothetical protein
MMYLDDGRNVDVLYGLDTLPSDPAKLPEVDVPVAVTHQQNAALETERQAAHAHILPGRCLPQLHHLRLPALSKV